MKKLFLICCFCALGILLFGCGQQDGDKIDLEKMTAVEILNVLTEQGYPMVTKTEYNDKADLKEYPWNLDGCTSAVQWKIPDNPELGPGGGTIEVYESATLAKARRDQAAVISSFYPSESYFVQIGKVFLEVPQTLTQQEAAQYQAALEAMAKGNMPLPLNDEKPSSQEVAAAKSVVEEYFRACEAKDSQAILKTLTPESVSPNTQLFGEETKTLLTIDYNPEDSKRQTYITSGRGSLYDIKEENVIIFRVSFNIEYPEGVIGVWNEEKYEDWGIILIRDDKDSPWLIDDQGY